MELGIFRNHTLSRSAAAGFGLLLAGLTLVADNPFMSGELVEADLTESVRKTKFGGKPKSEYFVTVVNPVPSVLVADKHRRDQMFHMSFKDAMKFDFEKMPVRGNKYRWKNDGILNLDLSDFRDDYQQYEYGGPSIQFQVRKLNLVEVSHSYREVWRGRINDDIKTVEDTYKLFQYWEWPTERPVLGGETVVIRVPFLSTKLGTLHEFYGETDSDGTITFHLRNIDYSKALLVDPLELTLELPGKGLTFSCTIPTEVIKFFRKNGGKARARP